MQWLLWLISLIVLISVLSFFNLDSVERTVDHIGLRSAIEVLKGVCACIGIPSLIWWFLMLVAKGEDESVGGRSDPPDWRPPGGGDINP